MAKKNGLRPWPADSVERWPIDKIKPYPNNPMSHGDEQISMLAERMTSLGVTTPVLVDEKGVLLFGHGRRLAAIKAGFEELPVCVARGWSEEEKRSYRIWDNQSSRRGDWDIPLLKGELSLLDGAGFDLSLTGFTDIQLSEFEDPVDPSGAEDVPEPPANPIVRKGDLWMLGEHRLLCGDATSKSDVAVCLGDAKPHLMVTDPPYGVKYDAHWRNEAMPAKNDPNRWRDGAGSPTGAVTNDDRSDWSAAWKLFPGDVSYCWAPGGAQQYDHFLALLKAGFETRTQIIWAKQQFPIGRGNYHIQHEPCWYAVRKGKTAHWQGDRTQSTLWQIDKPRKSETGHSTQKPIECMKRPIENNSKIGDWVYDPFVGSGTTIIAAEMTKRRALAIDIDPIYVEVAIERWSNFAKAKVTLEGDGRDFETIKRERLRPTKRLRRKSAARVSDNPPANG